MLAAFPKKDGNSLACFGSVSIGSNSTPHVPIRSSSDHRNDERL